MSRKPSPGVCSKCGRATVRPTPEVLERALALDMTVRYGHVWVSGHFYDADGRLLEVGCHEHEPQREWG